MHPIERITGTGIVKRKDGVLIGPRRYDIVVWQYPESEVEGLTDYELHIEWEPNEASALCGKELEIEVPGDRRLRFVVRSPGATVWATGGIEARDGSF